MTEGSIVAELIHCTFAGNAAFNQSGAFGGGGAVFNNHGVRAMVTNCIFWDNEWMGGKTTAGQLFSEPDAYATVTYTCMQGGWRGAGTNNIDLDPLFINAAGLDGIVGTLDDDLRLRPGSPAIDAGDNAAVPAEVLFDLDGDEVPSECEPELLAIMDGAARAFSAGFPDTFISPPNEDQPLMAFTLEATESLTLLSAQSSYTGPVGGGSGAAGAARAASPKCRRWRPSPIPRAACTPSSST